MLEHQLTSRGWKWPLSSLVVTVLLALLGPVILDLEDDLPLSLQSLLVCWLPLMLGWKAGVVGVLDYIILGAIGLPVFAGYRGGMDILSGPTGGYLLGMPVAALVLGAMTVDIPQEADDRARLMRIAMGMVIGHMVILAFGIPWQKNFNPDLDIEALLRRLMGPALLKCAMGTLLSVGVMRAMRKRA